MGSCLQGSHQDVRLDIPVGAGFFFGGDVAYASFSGTRKQNVNEIETASGVFNAAYNESGSQTVKPKTLDLMLMAGYKVTSNTSLGLGYRYQKILKLVDSGETNQGGFTSTPAGTTGDLTVKGIFAKAKFEF